MTKFETLSPEHKKMVYKYIHETTMVSCHACEHPMGCPVCEICAMTFGEHFTPNFTPSDTNKMVVYLYDKYYATCCSCCGGEIEGKLFDVEGDQLCSDCFFKALGAVRSEAHKDAAASPLAALQGTGLEGLSDIFGGLLSGLGGNK